MSIPFTMEGDTPSSHTPAWSAVCALTLCVGTLIASEFMPVSLLTPIATGLHISEGRAGQAIAVSGLFAARTLAWQLVTLPSLPSERMAHSGSVFRVLRRPQVPFGILAIATFFMGQFALFTYLRPFLEGVTRVDVSTLSVILLILGGSGLLGTFLIGLPLRKRLYSLLIAMLVTMAAIAVALIAAGHSVIIVGALLAGWGPIGTAAPVAWWTWLSKVLPDASEAGGGLVVAVIQMAVTAGASAGGFLFDRSGYQTTFALSAGLLFASALLTFLGWRSARVKHSALVPKSIADIA